MELKGCPRPATHPAPAALRSVGSMRMAICGSSGERFGAGEYNDLWEYSNGQWTWVNGSNVAADPGMAGAYQGTGVYGTLGVPDPANLPGARFVASGWIDSSGALWLFGGEGINSQGTIAVFNDLWKFSGGEWTWMGGSNLGNAFGVYGVKGAPDPANVPGSRTSATTWTDVQGNFWLFGGEGYDINGLICQQFPNECYLNDLWKYSNGQWTWMGGADTTGEPGFYGLEYVPAPGNSPSSREESAGWTDAQGNLWLFGGDGVDSRLNAYGLGEFLGQLNDLWEYANGEWTWMGGSNLAQNAGNYGTLGIAAATNLPPERQGAASWTDKSGNLWLFGGTALFSAGSPKFNDLWVFQPWASAGVPPPSPPPPTVTYTVGGTVYGLDGSGLVLQDNLADNLTLSSTGAFTFPAALASGENYSVTILTQPSNPQQVCILNNAVGTAIANVTNVQVMCTTVIAGHSQWTWMGGNGPANYGTLGKPAPGNLPPVRQYAANWTDASGNLWVFGGNAGSLGNNLIGPCGATPLTYFDFHDLWKYSGGQWTWVAGSQSTTSTQPGVYGTQGTPSSANFPGARHGAVTWTDVSGNFWVFGGIGIDSAGKQGDLSDLWEYSNGEWAWIAGSNLVGQSGSYGTQGTPAASNIPGARYAAVGWTDDAGDFWLFGGNTTEVFNDLWKYSDGQWTWVAGSNAANQKGVYGILGVPAASNSPGGRFSAAGWTDTSGNLWLFGGNGLDALDSPGSLNDLWRFSAGQWTWIGGSELKGNAGSYGVLGVPSPANLPPARYGASAWTQTDGSFRLFGGEFNDLWEYQP